jgi:TetR/AcrR family transcriptional regulator
MRKMVLAKKQRAKSTRARPLKVAAKHVEPRADKVRRKRLNEKGASADLLLSATAELLAGRSTLDVSFSEIARRSGMNAALIKYYFGNKEGLLLALIEREATLSLLGLRHLVEMDLPADKKLQMHISGIINSYYRSPYLKRLLHHLIGDTDTNAGRRIADFFVQPIIEAQRAILAQGEREGIFRPCDAELFYFSLTGACDHIFHAASSLKHVLGMADVSDKLRKRYIEHISDIYISGLMLKNRSVSSPIEESVSTD